MNYVYIALIIFGVNLMPAFGPPTWSLLVFAHLRWHLDPVILVPLGATCAAAARYLLALASRKFGRYLPERVRGNLDAANDYLSKRRRSMWVLFGVFVVSPLPSAQMFEAAGLLDLNLVMVTTAFFFGRLISYSFYLSVTTFAQSHIENLFGGAFSSVGAIVVEVVMMALVIALPFIKWKRSEPATT